MSTSRLVFNAAAVEALTLTAPFVVFLHFFRVSPSEPLDQGCDGDEEQHDDPRNAEETLLDAAETHVPHSQKDSQVCVGRGFFLDFPPLANVL